MAIPGNMLSLTTEMIDPNASGWTAKLNCTTSLGSGGRNGAGVLAVQSVAAGEMQARTVSSYPIIAGETYQVFADASATTVPERIGIRWLTEAGVEVAVTWSLTTATASATWHRISVAGVAPAGATRAQVLLSSTPVAGSVFSYFENAYLGLPLRTQGNLFSFGVETAEISASGWVAEVNASVSRQVPVVSWPVDWYLAGGHVIALTATGAGNAAISCTERAQVTPGVEYRAQVYMQPPTLAAASWIELRFFDINGNQISVERGALASAGTGWYRQYASGVAPATAATCSVAVGLDTASAGQVVRVETIVVTVAPQSRAGNALSFAAASFEQGVAGWTTASGVAVLSRSTPWGVAFYDGAYSLTVTSATASSSTIRSPIVDVPGAGGLSWRSELYLHVSAGGWTLTRSVRWLTAGGAFISATSGAAAAVPGGGWWWLSNSFTAPALAAQAQVEYMLTATATNSVLRIDGVALWQDEPLISAVAVDADAYITLTLRELDLGGLLTVYRVGVDGVRSLVRGSAGMLDRQLITVDLVVVEDYEAPLGVPVSYYAEIRDPEDGSLVSYRESGVVGLDPGDRNFSWLKDPANPQRNTRVLVKQAPDWKQPITQAEYRVRGRANAVIHSDVRSGAEGDFVCWTRTDEERKALGLLLSSGNVVLWQAAPGMGEDDVYVNVGELARPRVTPFAPEPWREWTLPMTTADMPTASGINGTSGRTWQDVLTENATWADLQARFATWEDVYLNLPIGG